MDRDPGDQRRATLRASDADREQFVEALRRHHAEGRLTTEEPAERIERASAARTFGDLDALATDLPALPPASSRAVPPAPSPGRPPSRPRRAEAKVNLVRTVLWFGLLSVVLTVVWAMTNFGGHFWPIWPILGFLLAIAGQLFYVYGSARPDDDRPRDR